MKKVWAILLALFWLVPACAADNPIKPDYRIRENYFFGMITDIFTNFGNYEGKMIQYEGFVMPIPEDAEDESISEAFAVVRMATCCGPDDYPIGFACEHSEVPADDAWVSVTGVLRSRSFQDDDYPYLEVKELVVMEKRGQEKVSQ